MSAPVQLQPESKYADIGNGLRIHYHEVGTGPNLICLHGAGPGATAWSNFKGNIDALSAGHRVFLVDMPQFGKSSKPLITGPRLTAFTGMIEAFMAAAGIESAHFIGNSFGGQVSLKMAIDAPQRVLSVTIIGSTPVAISALSPMPSEGVRLIANYYRGSGASLEKLRYLLSSLVYDASFLTDDILQERYETSLDPELIAVNTGPRPEYEDLTPDFGKIKAPALIVWGAEDRAGPIDIGLFMTRAIPNARMHVFNKCGHWAQVEKTVEFNELVLAFIQRAP
jgi:4,5:9,10-diseco-3-hydroxy-5,9,17-trioxoandrosta-1(10),2-diene-4-oate hydrolase